MCVPAWGSRSCDLDRSGLSTPADLLRAADLLNGAGVFEAWDGTPLPDAIGCP
ncbi:MAG: hypothetical protein IID38_06080 [Planctomycetes bacterium]|nr:hypothetical protein [Planctomycetota bacterium]